MKLKKVFAMLLACALTAQLCPIFSFAEGNGDEYTRTLDIRTDMVHDNPGGTPYITEYDNVEFLAERGLTGKVFFLSESAHLAIDWQDYDKNVFPEGSAGYNWVQTKKAEYTAKYKEAKEAGLKVYFMMDFVSLPNSMKTLYGDQILTNDKIDINKPKTKEIMAEMMKEIFAEFPDVDGIYPRYGESYVGYYSSYHFGNNPIGVSGTKANDHATLLKFFREEVCVKLDKEIVYRTWSTEIGANSFTTSPELYLEITDQVEPHENLYIAIKHTSGDFWRNYIFNQTLGIGKHQQIVEIQCAREYEGKGAHPNYIAGGVINGFPEYEWQMSDDKNKCLRDVVNKEDSNIVGIWTWSRGGGWGGPYVNGEEGTPDGSELWCDLNAYVLHEWAKDTSQNDEDLVIQYAKEVLGMSDKDAESFLQIALKSSDAVLYGKGTNSAPMLEVNWMRDSGINESLFNNCVNTMFNNKEADGSYTKLNERRLSVSLWNEITELAASLDDSLSCKEFIEVSCQYGRNLYSITERLYTVAILKKEVGTTGVLKLDEINAAVAEYDTLWAEWEALYEDYDCCATLYDRSGFDNIMADYRYKLSSTPAIKLNIGESSSIGISVSPYNMSDLEFISSDEAVASVSASGTVTAISDGIARIEAYTADGVLSTATMVYVGTDGGVIKDVIHENDFEDYTADEKLDWDMNVTTDKQYLTVTENGTKALTVISSGVGGGTSCYHTQEFTPTTGKINVQFDMSVKNKNSGYFFLCGSDGKIITQVDFRGDGIYVDVGGSVTKISDLPYNANEWYHISLEINTDEKTFVVSVNNTDARSFSFRETATDLGLYKVGLNRNAANNVYYDNIEIYTLSNPKVDVTAQDVASTVTNVTVKGTDSVLRLPAMPEGFKAELVSSSNTMLIDLDGNINLSSAQGEVTLGFKITKLDDSTTADAVNVTASLPSAMINLAPSGTAMDDGAHEYYSNDKSPANVNDGDPEGNDWQYKNIDGGNNGLDNVWVGVKLQQLSTVNEIKIYWEGGSRCSASTDGYTVQYSDDGVNWSDVPNAQYIYSTASDRPVDTVTLNVPLETQYIRVNCKKVDNSKGYAPKIYELQIFGAPDVGGNVPNPPEVMLGDTNGDGKINSTDFMQIRRQFLGLYSMNDEQLIAADVNKDGKINSTDFMQVRRHFLGLFDIFA